jgi:hypothetical protein
LIFDFDYRVEGSRGVLGGVKNMAAPHFFQTVISDGLILVKNGSFGHGDMCGQECSQGFGKDSFPSPGFTDQAGDFVFLDLDIYIFQDRNNLFCFNCKVLNF